VIRVIGILWGGVHPDEKISVSVRALAGQLIPTDHYYPPLLYYLNAISFAVMFAIGRLTGVWFGLDDFRAQYFQNPAPFELSARLVTAALAATSAPLAALVAQRLRVSWKSCLFIGLLVALLPPQVLLSHISKSDAPLCSALLLVVWTFLAGRDAPCSRLEAIGFGASIALAFSFKQSALFFVVPLFFGFIILTLGRGLGWLQVVRRALLVFFTIVVVWMPLNIGILLDLRNFLEYQDVQSQMSSRDSSLPDALRTWFFLLSSIQDGATLPAVLMWLLVPAVCRDRRTLWVWGASAGAMLMVAAITGPRQHSGLLLPYSVVVVVLGGVTAARLIEGSRRWRFAGVIALSAMLLCTTIGTLDVLEQALRLPMARLVGNAIVEIPGSDSTKILASLPPSAAIERVLSVSSEVTKAEREREKRLAREYGVTLPPFAPDRVEGRSVTGEGYFIYRMPWVIGGLEVYDEKDVRVVKPFSWPLQKEEYELGYWLGRGFSIFLLSNEENILNSPIPAYRQRYQQIRDRCQLFREILPQKPLFFDDTVRIYHDCR
jgi:hypothetical protein